MGIKPGLSVSNIIYIIYQYWMMIVEFRYRPNPNGAVEILGIHK